ncbi:PREDICTED: probable DNA primase large subunit [Atta cephalotes]|uniref:DNA primase large subunit C-terminal domain-containing protein n=1 Tax=Atta cephalotes TaxID=12957 RepID=A0A158NFG0_ATTCE|nr:PREDICTED: probable DNA primase large subunit [Atta cephalotes]
MIDVDIDMFYIIPPNGEIPFYIMEDCILTRLDYLRLLSEGSANEFDGKFEYLLENSTYDKIGHFVLRLLASASSDLCIYWIGKESLLFKHRLDSLSPRRLHKLLKQITWKLQIFKDKKSTIDTTLIELCKFYLQPLVFKHLTSNCHDCDNFRYEMRFEIVSDLVKERELALNNGNVITHCSDWKKVLQLLFSNYVINEMNIIKKQSQYMIKHDLRFHILNQKIQSYLFNEGVPHGKVTIDNIEAEAQKFPLCMQHLHSLLRRRHRLSHYARLYYSLFLKEIGMTLEDSIIFWKQEYSKPHTCTSVCSHNWQSNEKKFIYSIRHMYGLEGSRRTYKTPDCNLICVGISGATYEGGCPFKDFDTSVLRNLLQASINENEIEKFINNVSTKDPEVLCTTFLKLVRENDINDAIVKNPVQYYQRMIN